MRTVKADKDFTILHMQRIGNCNTDELCDWRPFNRLRQLKTSAPATCQQGKMWPGPKNAARGFYSTQHYITEQPPHDEHQQRCCNDDMSYYATIRK